MFKRIIYKKKNCKFCSKVIIPRKTEGSRDWDRREFCNKKCYSGWNVGENNHLWKGGIKTRPDGYLRDSKTDKYIHRLIMEKYLKRLLNSSEHIHHIDGNPKNNNIKNLIILTNSEHRKLEMQYAKRDKKGRFTK